MEEIAGTEKHIKLLFIGELSPTPQMWFCGEKQSVTFSDWSRPPCPWMGHYPQPRHPD